MDRKRNLFERPTALAVLVIVLSVILTVTILLACAGCTKANASQQNRFTHEFYGRVNGECAIYTITDTKTGVQYLVVDGHGTSVTVLQPGEG